MPFMFRPRLAKYAYLLILMVAALATNSSAQIATDFRGQWVLRIGDRVFLVLDLTQNSDMTSHFSGSLIRLQHFSSSLGGSFSDIKGPVVRYPVVRSTLHESCLSFTTQNPADKSDEDNFQLCVTGQKTGSLKIDIPGFEPWPVIKEEKPIALATDWDGARTYWLDESDTPDADMQQIFDADQKDRQPSSGKINWDVVSKSDVARRDATAKLLAECKLHTGKDFERAANVFQHGGKPDDYLLAHTLAMVAVARGQGSAIWIAAASLDRYLQSVHQPQIYGTQFSTKPNEHTTQEPYNRTLIPDALRRFLSVPSQAAQEEQSKEYDKENSRH